MEARGERDGFVRCVACLIVYEQPAEGCAEAGGAGCPECGSPAWLDVEIPLEEPAETTGA
jgi:hypothetical protein